MNFQLNIRGLDAETTASLLNKRQPRSGLILLEEQFLARIKAPTVQNDGRLGDSESKTQMESR
jgi:hypothetical protein